ncbi:MAG: DUF433 domain-containing protein [bacterium]|nr:DUF433 domain-containing protein [bacterium]
MEPLIISRPDLLGGKPCIRGTRISVEFVLELLANGATTEEVLDSYPHITAEGLAAAIGYAARAMKNEVIWDVKTSA